MTKSGRWDHMTREEKLQHLRRLRHRCQPLGHTGGFICFNVGVPPISKAVIDQWIAQVEAAPHSEGEGEE